MHPISPAERAQIASRIGVHEQYLYQCLTGRRPTPADRCPGIEQATDGKLTCEELRPDVRWHRVADPEWPHPEGRPCIDVAAPHPAIQAREQEASAEPTSTELPPAPPAPRVPATPAAVVAVGG